MPLTLLVTNSEFKLTRHAKYVKCVSDRRELYDKSLVRFVHYFIAKVSLESGHPTSLGDSSVTDKDKILWAVAMTESFSVATMMPHVNVQVWSLPTAQPSRRQLVK